MHVEFLASFNRDLNKIKLGPVKKSILKVILAIEKAKSFKSISNSKKLTGHKSAFRIRVGDYRIGVFVSGNKVQFARVVHRKDIYRYFP